jgi:glutaredoxin 3
MVKRLGVVKRLNPSVAKAAKPVPKVVIYATAWCPYCIRARRLLNDKGIDYTEIRVDLEPEQRAIMINKSRRRTVPQIFIDDQSIGGYDDLVRLERARELDTLLGLTKHK